ncbi:hypothetical protein [Jeotgalibacillus salarius]|uniref:Uncharacterized protein n=1 Tax=Jeotgalibacillus salarius TaxID=546023 RepID=A0A4Y8LIT2_9BACL|nr:hypothetical protein [Jeotgalibacillus salarius]TFE02378.1 hypothetical protein E2626_07300 [Jeotgalibacillus salarius]
MNDPYLPDSSINHRRGLSASRLTVIAAALTTVADAIDTVAAIRAVKEEEIDKIEVQKRYDQQNRILEDLKTQLEELKAQIASSDFKSEPVAPAYSINIETLHITLPGSESDSEEKS